MSRPYRPCLPSRVAKAPSGERWVHEIKHDGYRLIARLVEGCVHLYTKGGYDWAERYPLVVDALYRLKVSSIVLDGEATSRGAGGRDSFDALWNRTNDEPVRLLLALDGIARLEYVEHLAGDGPTIFAHACKLGLQAIVSKRLELPYREGPSKAWVKTKNKSHPAIMRVKEAFELDRSGG